MTGEAAHVAPAAPEAFGGYGFALPRVSVIVVNYNYAAYLEAAVESVYRQTYREIECILLDNGSTDGSREVIERLSARYPQMRTVFRGDNGGQSLASVEGLEATTAPYVTFLDADDVMLPDFLATHVFVHLSLRVPVGFTCSDMFQTLGDDLVLGTFVAFNAFVRAGGGAGEATMRPVDRGESALPLGPLRPVPQDAVRLVGPGQRDWPWASMSAFVFRRDALNLVMRNPALRTLTSNFDVYVARGVNVLAGSATIDRALTVYRMHSTNIFARHPQLANVFNFERGGANDHEQRVRRLLIDHFLDEAGTLLRKLQDQAQFLAALRLLNDLGPRLTSRERRGWTHLQERFVVALPVLAGLVPRAQLLLWLLQLRLSPFRLFARRPEA